MATTSWEIIEELAKQGHNNEPVVEIIVNGSPRRGNINSVSFNRSLNEIVIDADIEIDYEIVENEDE